MSKLSDAGISWVIVGQSTPVSKKTAPQVSWIREIVDAGDRAGCKIFLKNNLLPLFVEAGITKREDWTGLRQEIPAGSHT